MGIVESDNGALLICSQIITYGNAASEELTVMIREEIETMWNEPQAEIIYQDRVMPVRFRITASFQPELTDIDIYQNTDPRNNYFRIEAFVHGNISFVDGLGCNTGYFLLENLYQGSTTAAHEYGHTLGLGHPHDLDLRGKGVPGIMYPRGTLVDPPYQYDSTRPAGTKGGTMHPVFRKVTETDIRNLNLQSLAFTGGTAVLGEFTSVWHPDHTTTDPEGYY